MQFKTVIKILARLLTWLERYYVTEMTNIVLLEYLLLFYG